MKPQASAGRTDRLKQLESFVSIATRGSLTAAAKAEGVAPAIMGRRLDGLEQRLGEHGDELLREAGYSDAEIAALKKAHITATGD